MEGSTRRRVIGIFAACTIAVTCVAGIAHAKGKRPEQKGTFALLGGTPAVVSYFWTDHGNGLSATLKVRQFKLDDTTPILNYGMDMQRVMHMIVVRDDFSTFAHLHPALDTTTGTFQQRFTKDPNHRYYVYADTIPQGLSQQVFRFILPSSGSAPPNPSLTASAPTFAIGPYTATLSTTTITANQSQKIDLTIREGGKPASDLVPYLGGAAHAVLINTSSLAYIHVHPSVRGSHMSQATDSNSMAAMGGSGEAGPYMLIALPALPAGTYKLWVEFQSQSLKLYTIPFTVVAQ